MKDKNSSEYVMRKAFDLGFRQVMNPASGSSATYDSAYRAGYNAKQRWADAQARDLAIDAYEVSFEKWYDEWQDSPENKKKRAMSAYQFGVNGTFFSAGSNLEDQAYKAGIKAKAFNKEREELLERGTKQCPAEATFEDWWMQQSLTEEKGSGLNISDEAWAAIKDINEEPSELKSLTESTVQQLDLLAANVCYPNRTANRDSDCGHVKKGDVLTWDWPQLSFINSRTGKPHDRSVVELNTGDNIACLYTINKQNPPAHLIDDPQLVGVDISTALICVKAGGTMQQGDVFVPVEDEFMCMRDGSRYAGDLVLNIGDGLVPYTSHKRMIDLCNYIFREVPTVTGMRVTLLTPDFIRQGFYIKNGFVPSSALAI